MRWAFSDKPLAKREENINKNKSINSVVLSNEKAISNKGHFIHIFDYYQSNTDLMWSFLNLSQKLANCKMQEIVNEKQKLIWIKLEFKISVILIYEGNVGLELNVSTPIDSLAFGTLYTILWSIKRKYQ